MVLRDLIDHLKAGRPVTAKIVNRIINYLVTLEILNSSLEFTRKRLEKLEAKERGGIYLTNEEALMINEAMIELEELKSIKAQCDDKVSALNKEMYANIEKEL